MNYIFVTGMGRSGTASLANLLGQLSNAKVGHEYIGNREFWLLSWYQDANIYTMPYLEKVKNDIERECSDDYFIDVNGYLQNSVEQLRTVYSPAAIFHLVRDGRAVVRSIYSRRVESHIHLMPKTSAEVDRWLDWGKFERVCWNWANTTAKLIQQETTLINFENLVCDYEYFSSRFLEPFDFSLSYEDWSRSISRKINKTQPSWYRYLYAKWRGRPHVRERLPAYEEWPPDLKSTFKDICGEAMEMAGYRL